MTKLAKKLRALANGKELNWKQLVSLIEAYGGTVLAPRGGGSHFRIYITGYDPITIPVHGGKVKRIYAEQIALILEKVEE